MNEDTRVFTTDEAQEILNNVPAGDNGGQVIALYRLVKCLRTALTTAQEDNRKLAKQFVDMQAVAGHKTKKAEELESALAAARKENERLKQGVKNVYNWISTHTLPLGMHAELDALLRPATERGK